MASEVHVTGISNCCLDSRTSRGWLGQFGRADLARASGWSTQSLLGHGKPERVVVGYRIGDGDDLTPQLSS